MTHFSYIPNTQLSLRFRWGQANVLNLFHSCGFCGVDVTDSFWKYFLFYFDQLPLILHCAQIWIIIFARPNCLLCKQVFSGTLFSRRGSSRWLTFRFRFCLSLTGIYKLTWVDTAWLRMNVFLCHLKISNFFLSSFGTVIFLNTEISIVNKSITQNVEGIPMEKKFIVLAWQANLEWINIGVIYNSLALQAT